MDFINALFGRIFSCLNRVQPKTIIDNGTAAMAEDYKNARWPVVPAPADRPEEALVYNAGMRTVLFNENFHFNVRTMPPKAIAAVFAMGSTTPALSGTKPPRTQGRTMGLTDYLSSRCNKGERNDALFKAVLLAREEGWSESQIISELGNKALSDGLPQQEITKTINSAMAHTLTPRPPRQRQSPNPPALAWDATLTGHVTQLVPAIPGPADDWDTTDLPMFLDALFKEDEIAAYNVQTKDEGDGPVPKGWGVHNRPVSDMLAECERMPAKDVLGAGPHGGWIRLNPMDGQGINDTNCVEFRHCLVECDDVAIEDQWAILNRLRVPCSTVVHSGKKSLHFAVRIDAGTDRVEYQRRVKKLYDVLEEAGLHVDRKNKNPSRLSRIPGIMRDGKPQYLVALQIGCGSWLEWTEQLASEQDGLPPIESMADLLAAPPPLSPELIQTVLRRGHKLMLSSGSKGMKTYTLIHLACAVSHGGDWLGYQCAKGRVLYLNLEVDRASFVQRVIDVSAHAGIDPQNFCVWHLRGFSEPLDKLCAHIFRHVQEQSYDLIVLDPLYKVLTGDENSARDMSILCNYIDKIAVRLGASVVIASHFTKGAPGMKASIDRASGSGVFGRDPDAVGTITPLEKHDDGAELEWTLREFKKPPKAYLQWMWPIWTIQPGYAGAKLRGQKGTGSKVTQGKLIAVVQQLATSTLPNAAGVAEVAEELGVSERTLRRYPEKYQNIEIENNLVKIVGDVGHYEAYEDDDEEEPTV